MKNRIKPQQARKGQPTQAFFQTIQKSHAARNINTPNMNGKNGLGKDGVGRTFNQRSNRSIP